MEEIKTRYKKKYNLEQYMELISFFKNETSLFYTRNNIFLGLYFVAIGGIITEFESLIKFSILLRFFLFFVLIIAIVNTISSFRSLVFQNQLLQLIRSIEKKSEYKLWIMDRFHGLHNSAPWYRFSFFKNNANIQPKVFVLMSFCLVLFWILLMIYIETYLI